MIPDWLTTTPRRRTGTTAEAKPPATVTPTPQKQPVINRNPYSVLATPTEPPEVPDRKTAALTETDSIGSEISDYWDDADTMTSPEDKNTDSLATHMKEQGKEEPNDDPSLMDLIKYKARLATALTKCCMDKYFGGYVFIIMNDEEEYQNRIGDHERQHKMPEQPTRPKVPDEPTRGDLFRYAKDKKAHKEYLQYNQEAVDLIERKFPGGLNGLKDDAGNLPIQLTAKAALSHITNNIVSEPAKDHSKILQGLLSRTYQPNAKGAEDYFVEANSDRLMAKHLGFPYIPYSMIMTSAQTAFANSAFDDDLIHKIDTKWNSIKAAEPAYKDTDSRTSYIAFKNHYNKELKILYKLKPRANRKGTAHQATEVMDREWKEQVEESVFDLHSALNAIKNANQPSIAPPTDAVCIPAGTASTVAMSATTLATKDQIQQSEERIMNSMRQMLSNNGNNRDNGRSNSNRNGNHTYRPRQYLFWCFSCGCNLSHDTRQCRTKQRAGHDQHLSATIDDPQGGNTSKDDRQGKWNGPNGAILDHKPNN